MRVKKVDAEILAQQSDVSEDVVSTTKDAKEKEAQEKRARQARNLAIADRMIEEHNFRSTLPNLHEVAAQTCDDMARISAALGTYLGFLDLKNETNPDSAGQHALLSPIKDQLEQSGRRLSAVLCSGGAVGGSQRAPHSRLRYLQPPCLPGRFSA